MFDFTSRMYLAQIAGALVIIAAVAVLFLAKFEPKIIKKSGR